MAKHPKQTGHRKSKGVKVAAGHYGPQKPIGSMSMARKQTRHR